MRQASLSVSIIIFFIISGQAQVNAPNTPELVIPDMEFAFYRYDSLMQLEVLYYPYSDLWDIDHDGVNDSILFKGNGGVHTYFEFQIKLSSDKKWRNFSSFQIDMPYLSSPGIINSSKQFSVADFDEDSIPEIYLNLDNHFASVPDSWKALGVRSNQIIIEFEDDSLIIRDYLAEIHQLPDFKLQAKFINHLVVKPLKLGEDSTSIASNYLSSRNSKIENQEIEKIWSDSLSDMSWAKLYYEYINYPKKALRYMIQGAVTVVFTLDLEGNLIDYEITKSIPYLDEALIAAFEKLPKWVNTDLSAYPPFQAYKLNIDFNIE